MILFIHQASTSLVESITWICISSCLLASFLFVSIILISRILKTYRTKKFTALCDHLQRKLNVFVLYRSEQDNRKPFLWNYHVQELRHQIRSHDRKQLMVNLLIANKQNLAGRSALILQKIYVRLSLRRFSMSKLSHHNNRTKIQGMQELAEMECAEALPIMQSLFHHRNKKVREESFIAMVRLTGAAPFALLTRYSDSISDWMQLIIHKHLSTLPERQLPNFYLWLTADNPAVRKFAISMINEFKQLKAVPALASLLTDKDLEIAAMAADTLGNLGASEHAESIAQLGKHNMLNKLVSTAVIRALARIGTGANQLSFLSWHMIHGTCTVRREAIRALLVLKINLADLRVDFNLDNDKEFDGIYAHLTHPLLQ